MRSRSSRGSPYNTVRYRRLKKVFIANAAPFCTYPKCPVPGRYIDKTLSGNHKWGPTIDHRHPTSRGGSMWDVSNWALCHRHCNGSKGTRTDRPTRTPYTWT